MILPIIYVTFTSHSISAPQEVWEVNHIMEVNANVFDTIEKIDDYPFQTTLELFRNELYKILYRKSHLDMRWITLRHTTLAKLITGKKRKIYWHRIRSRCWVCKPEPAQAILLFVVLIMVF